MGIALSGPAMPISEKTIARLNELISQGKTDKQAAEIAGVGIATIGRYRKKGAIIAGHGKHAIQRIDLKHDVTPQKPGTRIDGTAIPFAENDAFADDGSDDLMMTYEPNDTAKEIEKKAPTLTRSTRISGTYTELSLSDSSASLAFPCSHWEFTKKENVVGLLDDLISELQAIRAEA